MTRIIAFVLRAGGAVGGGFAARYVPPETLITVLTDAGLGPEGGLTPPAAAIALCALGALFGFLFGSTIAGILPAGSREPVGTREEAAASVPRLRRHLSNESGKPSRSGSPLDRLSAPPAGQQLPKHDLSHIPPAPQDDEITFERIPNTGFYADIESPMNFDDDEDLARFAHARDEQAPGGRVSDEDAWDEDAGWDTPAHDPEPAAHGGTSHGENMAHESIDDEWKAADTRSGEMPFEDEWVQQAPVQPEAVTQPGDIHPRADESAGHIDATPSEDQWPEGIPLPPTLEEQGWGAQRSIGKSAPDAPQAVEPDALAADVVNLSDVEEDEQGGAGLHEMSFEVEDTPDITAFDQPQEPQEQVADEPVYPHAVPDPATQVWEQPEPQSAQPPVENVHQGTGHDGYSVPRFAPGLTGGMENDWFAGEADEEEDADDDGAGYGSLMAIGLGKTHQPRPKAPTHRLGEANLSHMPLLDGERDANIIPRGAGPQDFRLREALEELKRV